MTRVKTLKQLKEELRDLFSLFIRLRDSDMYGYGKCITCGRRNHYKKMDAGHYIKRQYLATDFDERNVNLQCKHCNAFEQGSDAKYRVAIDEKWGKGTAEMLEIKKFNKAKYGRFEYEILIKEYEDKLKEML